MKPEDFGLPAGIQVLDMNSPTFPQDFTEALGLARGEKLEITTPQFTRTDGNTVPDKFRPKTRLEWITLWARSPEELKAAGCGIWDKAPNGDIHWLFPKEWYPYIPQGLTILHIDGAIETFCADTDDDARFGCLSFGFLQRANT